MRSALEAVHSQFESDGFTYNDVKQQWRNLKDIFYKRYEVSLKRAQSGEEPFKIKPCWVHFDELKFLLINQQLVDPESRGRHRRCLAYDINTEFTDLNNDNEEFNNSEYLNEERNLEIKEELINNNEYCNNLNLSDNNIYINNNTEEELEDQLFNIKKQNEQKKYLNKKRKNISINKQINNQQDRFKYFGVFVESAVRDLHQESPELARRLMQNIYSNISSHQMESTTFSSRTLK